MKLPFDYIYRNEQIHFSITLKTNDMKMKLKFIATAFCMVMGLSLSAQTTQNTSPEKAPKQYPSEKMVKELNLTPKQITELKNLQEEQQADREKFRQEQQALTKEMKKDSAERKAAMDKRRNEHQAKLKTILTPEQYTKYLEMQLNQRSKMDKKGQDRGKQGDRKKQRMQPRQDTQNTPNN